ncbi:MAG: phospholipase D-like domain-containing protein [Dolichospermum sp.]
MHNKFCMIDLKTVIHGSYNWTNKARFNKETITTIQDDRETAEKFADQFIQLKRTLISQ